MTASQRLKLLRADARNQTLVVLVWGPGDPGSPASPMNQYWVKRTQIRDNLQKVFPNSEILFSESDALRDHTRDLEDLLVEELAHATIADCILVLDVSRGAHVEVDRFSGNPTIAAKLRVLLPERFVGGTGLVSHVHRNIRVVGFSDDELQACHVATKKAVSIVDSVAIQRLMQPRMYV